MQPLVVVAEQVDPSEGLLSHRSFQRARLLSVLALNLGESEQPRSFGLILVLSKGREISMADPRDEDSLLSHLYSLSCGKTKEIVPPCTLTRTTAPPLRNL